MKGIVKMLRNIIPGFGVLVLLASCSVNVRTMRDKKMDFSRYETFCWMDGCRFRFRGPAYFTDSLFRVGMEQSLITSLAAKGLSLQKDKADVLVGITITVADRQQYFNGKPVMPHRPGDVRYDLKGTVVLAIAESRTGKMIYESTIFKFLDAGEPVPDRKVRRMVNVLLRNYPENLKGVITVP